MIEYGLISKVDSDTIENTLDLAYNEFNCTLNITEVGLFNCLTSVGINDYMWEKYKCGVNYTGIDNEKDKKIIPPHWMNLIKGNSNEVYNQLKDESQHFLFLDACHCFSHVVSDFFCYAPKVKVGGYLLFHDTGEHIKPFKDFQHGDKENPDAYISVRKALDSMGLLKNYAYGFRQNGGEHYIRIGDYGFQLIFDESDTNDEAGGISAFKKLY